MTYFIRTYGCQFNSADSATLERLLRARGWRPARSPDEARLVIFNTCAVREHAEERLAQNMRALVARAEKKGRKPLVGLIGCVPPLRKEALFRQFPFLAFAAGPEALAEVPEMADRASREREKGVAALESGGESDFFPGPAVNAGSALLPVMTGCDNFCSYCVVPYTRGREKSRPGAEITAEAAALAAKGVFQLTLIGQNVNSWRDPRSDATFPDLLREVAGIEGLLRIGFLTSHPRDTGTALLEAMAAGAAVYRHLHLPLQSGSNRVLTAMNRHYTREEYREITREARRLMPEISITSDIIVGFPGETGRDFADTLDLVEEIGFDDLFAFKYSDRPGTRAAKMPDRVPENTARDRLAELWAVQDRISLERAGRFAGLTCETLAERKSAKKQGHLIGRIETGRKILFPGAESLVGKLVRVRVEKAERHLLYGRPVEKEDSGARAES